MFASTTLRPGLLVSVKTSIRGNCSYFTTTLEGDHITEAGERRARWETERVVNDPVEHERALKVRSLARSAVQTVCAHSDFGLICPEDKADKLAAAVFKARDLCVEFNNSAAVTQVRFNVLVGKVSADDVEAVKAINGEIRDLMDTMARGLANLDVEAVRNAAIKAKSVGKVLEANAQARVQKAVEVARAAAREIVKAGETGAVEIDQVAIQRLSEARTAFLDVDLEGDTQAPAAAAPVAVDFDVQATVAQLLDTYGADAEIEVTFEEPTEEPEEKAASPFVTSVIFE
jgi:hypothetical protein